MADKFRWRYLVLSTDTKTSTCFFYLLTTRPPASITNNWSFVIWPKGYLPGNCTTLLLKCHISIVKVMTLIIAGHTIISKIKINLINIRHTRLNYHIIKFPYSHSIRIFLKLIFCICIFLLNNLNRLILFTLIIFS